MALEYEFKCPVCDKKILSKNRDTEFYCDGKNLEAKDSSHDVEKLKRVFSLGGISFKGNGFYKNEK